MVVAMTAPQNSYWEKVIIHIMNSKHSISGPIQRRFYRRDKHCHFLNVILVVDNDGFITFLKGGYLGHLVDVTCFQYARVPRLPDGLYLLGDSGFAATPQLVVPARPGQLPGHIRRNVNRLGLITDL